MFITLGSKKFNVSNIRILKSDIDSARTTITDSEGRSFFINDSKENIRDQIVIEFPIIKFIEATDFNKSSLLIAADHIIEYSIDPNDSDKTILVFRDAKYLKVETDRSLLDQVKEITNTEIKILYESNPDTNAFTDQSVIDLQDSVAHIGHTSVHSATSLPTPSRIIIRDVDGRAQIYSPLEPEDIARLDTVTTAINNLINAAPETLNTLGKLALAINNDPGFSVTINELIATKETPAGAQSKVDTHADLTSPHGASATVVASSLALRDESGKLAGDILGNAATATNLATVNTTSIFENQTAATDLKLSQHLPNGFNIHNIRKSGFFVGNELTINAPEASWFFYDVKVMAEVWITIIAQNMFNQASYIKTGSDVGGVLTWGAWAQLTSTDGKAMQAVSVDYAVSSGYANNAADLLGAIIVQAADITPTGWLYCNGAAISRTAYSALFGRIGTLYGAGDGWSTFNIPDLRGVFLRGQDAGRGIDPNRVLGSFQWDELRSHAHSYDRCPAAGYGTGGYPGSAGPSSATSGYTGGAETRPVNVAVHYMIKY